MNRKSEAVILLIFIICVFFYTPAVAETSFFPERSFLEANKDYENNDTNKAIDKYKELIHRGCINADLYYNLGTAYLKKGDIGRSILNFERALILSPRDSDIIFNLSYARSLMKQKDPVPDTPWYITAITDIFKSFNLRENIIFADAILYLMTAFIIFSFFFRYLRPYLTAGAIFLLFCIVLQIVPLRDKLKIERQGAIVIENITDAKAEPEDQSEILFPLYEGMKVFILRKSASWIRVEHMDKRIGWVHDNAIERICP